MPMVSSAGNLDFWLRLCGVRGLPECVELLAAFPRQDELGKEAFDAAVKRWNADFIQRVRLLMQDKQCLGYERFGRERAAFGAE